MTDPVFFAPSRRISVSEIAELTGAKLADQTHGERLVDGIASAADGGEGKLVFVEGKRNATLLKSLSAAAVLCTSDFAELVPPGIAALVTPQAATGIRADRTAALSGGGAPAADDRRDRNFAARRHFEGSQAGSRRHRRGRRGDRPGRGDRVGHGRCRQRGDRRIDRRSDATAMSDRAPASSAR